MLDGGAGHDTLNGGVGSDTLIGGTGFDAYVFNTTLGAANVDRITGFSVPNDVMHLDNAVFTGLPNGGLAPAAFFRGPGPHDTNDRIIYNAATGGLFFDPDGTGAAATVRFATLAPGLALSSTDFLVI